LLAQRFDAVTLRLSGEPFALTSNVAHDAVGANASFSVSADGRVLVHLMAADQTDELSWLDRRGARIGAVIAEGPFQQIRLAPGGRQVALVSSDRDSGNRDIWLVETASGALTRLTSHPANDWHPVWSPDGNRSYSPPIATAFLRSIASRLTVPDLKHRCRQEQSPATGFLTIGRQPAHCSRFIPARPKQPWTSG
jgi:hypothetical protein